MKKILVLFAAILCFDGTSPLFYGANTGLSQTKTLSTAIKKCQTAVEPVNANICKTVKTTLKFDSDNYVASSKALTDLSYVFVDINGFFSNFLNCLNDQNETSTGVTTIRNLEILIYQLEFYVITGIDSKMFASAGTLGQVFGEKTRDAITRISETLRDEFSKIKSNIETIRDSFRAIVDSGSEITVESINATLSETSFTEMITSFTLIETTSKQASEVFASFVVVMATLEKVTSSVQATKAKSSAMVSMADYILDITVQSSKITFSNKTLKQEADIDESFSKFYEVAALQFTGDSEVQESRTNVEMLVISMKTSFDEMSNRFSRIFSDSFTDFTRQITILKETVSTSTKQVTDYLAEAVADNSGSYSKCLSAEGNNSKMATTIIEALGMSSSLCIAQQTNVSMAAQYLMTFIADDVVLNLNGTSDRLCGCAVKGDKKVEARSKRCFKRRTDEMTSQIDEERTYLNDELSTIETTVRMSAESFSDCSNNVTIAFDASFENLKTAIKACTAV